MAKNKETVESGVVESASPESVEVVGKAGQIKIEKSQLSAYKSRGYITLEEHEKKNAPKSVVPLSSRTEV